MRRVSVVPQAKPDELVNSVDFSARTVVVSSLAIALEGSGLSSPHPADWQLFPE